MSFTSDIARYAKKTNLTVNDAVVAICSQATTAIIKRTPVDTGRARSNWYTTIDTDTSETSDTRAESEALADGLSTAQKASGKVFNLTNNLAYINSLEKGSSTQSPSGFLRVTAAEISQKLKALR